jgi:hypothetical protein
MWKMCLIGAIAMFVAVLLLAGLAALSFVTLLSGDGKEASVAVPHAAMAKTSVPWPLEFVRETPPGDLQDNPAVPGSSCVLTLDNGAPSGKPELVLVPVNRSRRSAGWSYWHLLSPEVGNLPSPASGPPFSAVVKDSSSAK